MNETEQLRRDAERYKDQYPPGTRIELLSMGNDPLPVKSGTRGTVVRVDAMGTLQCNFDDGRRLGIIPGEDSFRTLTDEEIKSEQEQQKNEKEEVKDSPVQSM